MDFPDINGISDIQETEAMVGSRTTLNFSPRSHHFGNIQSLQHFMNDQNDLSSYTTKRQQNNPSFHELRDYVEKTLSSWGLKLGYLTESYENKLIINCFMELISQKYKQQQSKEQLRKSLAAKSFESNKYSSLLEQQRLNSTQKSKMIGRLQNTISQYKSKYKSLEQSCKKQKEQDKKMIAMLKSKNEQILHQIKKKQQEISRVKEQMKKNVGQKGTIKNISFEVYQVLPKQQSDNAKDKLVVLAQRYESQKKNLLKENLLLRQKLYDIRQEIVSFAEWVDTNLFRQTNSNYKNKLIVNHNLLFKKESLVAELAQILENARSGMNDLLNMYEQGKKYRKHPQNSEQQIRNQKFGGQNLSPNKIVKQSQMMKKPRQTIPTMKKRPTVQEMKVQKQPFTIPNLKKQAKTLQPQYEVKDEESELSMISHLSVQEIVSENKNLEKWDILFNHLQ